MANMTENELLAAIFEQAGDAMIYIDREGVIQRWNRKAVELFGFTATQAVGENVTIMIPERLRDAHDKGFHTAVAQGRLSSDGKARRTKALTADGGKVYVEMTFAIVTGEGGQAVGSVAVAREWQKPGAD